jgi:polyvinyl alcohol dehydrogenase (cytochrome)
MVWAHDPDNRGALVWKENLANGPVSDNGQITWGGAADQQSVYFGLHSGGVMALRLTDGAHRWFAPLTPKETMKDHVGQNGPVSAIPGVVFSGGWDGVLRAISAEDGSVLWEYNTVQNYDTVNHVTAKGGSMGATGPVIAGGMVFVGSGFIGVQNGIPGNVVLAFSAK